MARIFTTTDAELAARSWFHDITLAAGINTKNLKSSVPYLVQRTDLHKHASKICDELINRDFDNIDPSIRILADRSFETNGKHKRFKVEQVAKAIVYIAELMQLYWDDTVRTPYEIDEFKKTLLGSAVYKYGRYISAIPDKGQRVKAAASGNTSTSRAPGQPPKNNYKQTGPQSGNVRDLLDLNGSPGTPGQKVYGSNSQGLMFKIMGDNTMSKNKANVYIKPLSASGAHGTTNKIFIASGNGYTDCTCYFDELRDAQAMLNKIIADNRVPSNVQNLQVVKLKADPNGYFLVGTEYGMCAISAKTLNEALAESIDETGGWEKATESCTREELDELHTWMRRG